MARLERCFRPIRLPGYGVAPLARFDVDHADQYCTYLYYVANELWRADGDGSRAARIYGLNKALNAVNVLYDAALPEVWLLIHGVGTVLGKASYKNYFVATQHCTVGAIGGVFPTMSEGLILSAGSAVIGHCTVGRNVLVEPHVAIVNTDVESDRRVAGQRNAYVFREQTERAMRHYFDLDVPI